MHDPRKTLTRHESSLLPLEAIRHEYATRRGQHQCTPADDDLLTDESLAAAATCYAMPCRDLAVADDGTPFLWPFSHDWHPEDRRTSLVKAAALLVAEIERLDRAAS